VIGINTTMPTDMRRDVTKYSSNHSTLKTWPNLKKKKPHNTNRLTQARAESWISKPCQCFVAAPGNQGSMSWSIIEHNRLETVSYRNV
jgi:hypothetical protein